MFGPKVYELSLVKTYVSHWGMVHAVREIIQNALDSDSPFIYDFIKNEDSWTLHLNSEFANLSPTTLLLGSSSKRDDDSAIGSFGEGYKIALLVLTRLGHDVDMLNGNKLWKPRFKFNAKFNEELLIIEETDLSQKNKGLTFLVHGLTDQDVSEIVSSCIRMQENIGAIKRTSYGDILLDRPTELYVGGLYICKTDLKYGYNIKPEHIKLERDRQTVADFDLRYTTKEMWFETEDFDCIAELIEQEIPDLEYAQYSSPELVKEACYKLFREKNPGKVIAKSNEEMESLVKKGMTVYVGGGNYYANVSSSKSYRKENHIALTIEPPVMFLTRWLSANRSEMRSKAIESFRKDLIAEAKNWKV